MKKIYVFLDIDGVILDYSYSDNMYQNSFAMFTERFFKLLNYTDEIIPVWSTSWWHVFKDRTHPYYQDSPDAWMAMFKRIAHNKFIEDEYTISNLLNDLMIKTLNPGYRGCRTSLIYNTEFELITDEKHTNFLFVDDFNLLDSLESKLGKNLAEDSISRVCLRDQNGLMPVIEKIEEKLLYWNTTNENNIRRIVEISK